MSKMKNNTVKRSITVHAFQPVNVWRTTGDKIRKSIAYLIIRDRKESIAEFIDKAVDERIKLLGLDNK